MIGPGRGLFSKDKQNSSDSDSSFSSESDNEATSGNQLRKKIYKAPEEGSFNSPGNGKLLIEAKDKEKSNKIYNLLEKLNLGKTYQSFSKRPVSNKKLKNKRTDRSNIVDRPPPSNAAREFKQARSFINTRESLEKLEKSIPWKERVDLETHVKCISCMELDKSCSRLVVGSDDHIISFWDLDNMNSSMKPFRTLRPIDGQPVIALSFNKKQEKLLVCGAGCQPKLLTRDGREIVEFVKGDMYIKDLKYTKGHTSNITQGLCDPFSENLCYTSSVDGTLRVWDLDSKLFGVEQQLPNSLVFKTLDKQKRRLSAQTFCYLNSKRALAVFCEKGNLQIFDSNNRYQRPELTHKFGYQAEVTSCICLEDPYRIACRTFQDGAVRIFDIRRLDKVERIWHGIYNNHSRTGLDVSPDGNLLVTGKSFDRDSEGGVVFLDIYGRFPGEDNFIQGSTPNTQQEEAPIQVTPKGKVFKEDILPGLAGKVQGVYQDNSKQENFRENYVLTKRPQIVKGLYDSNNNSSDVFATIKSGMNHTTVVKWPKKLNQIIAGCGNSISIFFDRAKSKRGVLPALKRMKTKPKIGKPFL